MYPVGPELDLALRRVRGEGGFAHDDAFCLSLLSYFQTIVNLGDQVVLADTTFDTIAKKVVYPIVDILPEALDIVDMRIGDRRLTRIPHYKWLGLSYGYSWFRTMATVPTSYCQVGRTHVVMYPGCVTPVTVSVRYVKKLVEFETRDSALEMSLDAFTGVQDLMQIALLLRQRNLAEAVERIKEVFNVKG